MSKSVDDNGYITWVDVPLTREGIFDYLGREIDPNGKMGLEPEKIYKVYRPKSEVCKDSFVKSLEQKPLVDDHTMLGELGQPAEKKGVHGVLSDVKVVGNELHGTITVWSDTLKRKIMSGKRELSLGYQGVLRKQHGRFMGQDYDFVQHSLSANHIALVDLARMGHACKLADNAIVLCDSLELPKMENKDKCADEIIEKLKGCSDEDLAKVKDFLASNGKPTEDEEAKKKAEEEAAKKAAEDEAKKKAEEEEAKKKAEADEAAKKAAEEEEAKKKAEEEAKKTEDEKKSVADAAIAEYKKAQEFAKRCEGKFGTICMDGLNTVKAVAEKICSLDPALKFIDSGKAVEAVTSIVEDFEKSKSKKVDVVDSTKKASCFDFLSAFRSRK